MKKKPKFIVIGSMKFGTSTIFRPHGQHPKVFKMRVDSFPDKLFKTGGGYYD